MHVLGFAFFLMVLIAAVGAIASTVLPYRQRIVAALLGRPMAQGRTTVRVDQRLIRRGPSLSHDTPIRLAPMRAQFALAA